MPSEVRFAKVRSLLEQAGYSLARVGGSHHNFEKAGMPLVSIPVHRGKVKTVYVRQVKKIVEAESVDRPFAPEILSKAQQLVDQYQVILRFEDGEWYGRVLELPHVFGDGATPEECVTSTREALIGAVAYMLEQDQRPPTPAREGTRTERVPYSRMNRGTSESLRYLHT